MRITYWHTLGLFMAGWLMTGTIGLVPAILITGGAAVMFLVFSKR